MARRDATRDGQLPYEGNLYESFMRRHLSHYGYYTGQNSTYRPRLTSDGWRFESNDASSSESQDSQNSDDNDLERIRTTQLVVSLESGRLVPRLRAPRHLFRDVDGGCTNALHQKPRWPEELEMIQEAVRHRHCVPSIAENFYVPTGFERVPEIKGLEIGSGGGQLVYELKAKPGFFFRQSRVLDKREDSTLASTAQHLQAENILIFESRFESGNLDKAVKVGEYEYELWLRKDLYTSKHTQWFYFKVTNMVAGMNYRFTICNFTKTSSLYESGMQPVMYSETDARAFHQGWRRTGSDIKYFRTSTRYFDGKSERCYYALTFTVRFSHNNDNVYLAHCYPYTYTDLREYLHAITSDDSKSKICKVRILCRSLAGNPVYLLTVTSPTDGFADVHKAKKGVVVTARVHPGESNSSWMMKGLIDFLLGDSAKAASLRQKFVFKVVPMLNPDGVIVGNYRCSLTGRDLNRNYLSSLKDSFPSIWHTKCMIQRLQEERPVELFCDMHGHSKKQNVFMYGCENMSDPATRFHERVFPVMMSKRLPDVFQLDDCHFVVQKTKEGTGRVAVWNMGVTNSYTLEATFCGSTLGAKRNSQFTISDYESVGRSLCETLFDYSEVDRSEFLGILSEIREMLKRRILAAGGLGRRTVPTGASGYDNQLAAEATGGCLSGDDVPRPEMDADDDDLLIAACSSVMSDESNDSGSDSSASDGLPTNLEFMKKVAGSKQRKAKKRNEKRKGAKIEKVTENPVKAHQVVASPGQAYRSAVLSLDSTPFEASEPKNQPRHRRESKQQVNERVYPASSIQSTTQSLSDNRESTVGSVGFRLPRRGSRDSTSRTASNGRKLSNPDLKDLYNLEALDDHYLADGLLSAQHLRNERDILVAMEMAERVGSFRDATPRAAAHGEQDVPESPELLLAPAAGKGRTRALTWLPSRGNILRHRTSLAKVGSAGEAPATIVDAEAAKDGTKKNLCLKQYPLPFDQSLDTLRVSSNSRYKLYGYNAVLMPAQRRASDGNSEVSPACGGSSSGHAAAVPTGSATVATGDAEERHSGVRLLAAYADAAAAYGSRLAGSWQQEVTSDVLHSRGTAGSLHGSLSRRGDGDARGSSSSSGDRVADQESHKQKPPNKVTCSPTQTPSSLATGGALGADESAGALPAQPRWRQQRRPTLASSPLDASRTLRHLPR